MVNGKPNSTKRGPAVTSATRRRFLQDTALVASGVVALTIGTVTFAPSPRHAARAQTAPVVRRNIVTMQSDFPGEFEAFREATRILRARADDDPTGWFVNGDLHNQFCATAPRNSPKQIHFGWWFLAWHRAYLWVTEQKLHAAVGARGFGLPYWDWRANRTVPEGYKGEDNPLNHDRRFERPFPPLTDGEVSLDSMRLRTFSAFWQPDPLVPAPPSFGGLPRPDALGRLGSGVLESGPHGQVHVYTGGFDENGQPGDMTIFSRAAQDPTFFGHHGNIDRIWESWRADPARRATEPTTDPVFMTRSFPFIGADGLPIALTVADTLNTLNLGYVYDALEPIPGAPLVAVAGVGPVGGGDRSVGAEAIPEAEPIARATVAVPAQVRAAGPARFGVTGEPQLVFLTIEGVRLPQRSVSVRVFVDHPAADAETPLDEASFAGAFALVRTGGPADEEGAIDVNVDITEAFNRVNADAERLSVTLVPIPFREGEEFEPLAYESMRLQIYDG
jgi:polyphenol oxidase